MIYILIGKSNSGKSTVERLLVDKYEFLTVPSFTTRPIRRREVNGKDYYFITEEEFVDKIANGEMIEHRVYNTIYGDWYYGLGEYEFNTELDYVLVLEVDGAKAVLEKYGEDLVRVIYLDCDEGVRKARAMRRTDWNVKEYERRKITDNNDFSYERLFGLINKRISVTSESTNDIAYGICRYSVDTLLEQIQKSLYRNNYEISC